MKKKIEWKREGKSTYLVYDGRHKGYMTCHYTLNNGELIHVYSGKSRLIAECYAVEDARKILLCDAKGLI